ncbi:transporter [Cytophagaceae bacterium SJW1-29]|uniref:Transporter n=2 Tax=Salmonirosea aquatica TaxID=2654236 RepID=A0A7C9BBY7_9BACT|nr:transporter [Cytophagaceae bacterium SJW1-29]
MVPRISAQVLTLEGCYTLVRQNYPMVKQRALIEKMRDFTVSNAAKGTLPQLSVGGQATYQSAVTRIPIEVPGLDIPTLSKDQYKIFGEISQSLTDGPVVSQQKELARVSAAAETQKVEVELYKLRERVNQLFFGILLLEAQIKQTELLENDIRVGLNKTEAAIANGTALKSNADILNAELLKTEQRRIELRANRQGYADMLALLINQPVEESTVLETPPVPGLSPDINRPELGLYEVQQKSFEVQNRLLSARLNPRLSLFVQGGYGRPALNLLSNTFDFYALGGVRLNWNLNAFYTLKNDRELLTINRSTVDLQRETFLFNTRISLKQQGSEINKYQALIDTDNRIIALRDQVKTTANTQLEFGTLTVNDYLTYLNAEDQARQNLLLHQIQLLMAQYAYAVTTGN